MIRRPPISPRMDTLLPYTPLFRSGVDRDGRALLRVAHQSGGAERRIGRGEDAHHAVAGGLHRAAARDARLGVELGQDLRGQPVRRLVAMGLVELRAAVNIGEEHRQVLAALGFLLRWARWVHRAHWVRRYVVHGTVFADSDTPGRKG